MVAPSAMKPLSPRNIESELSYAYLHAVAASAGVDCGVGTRHEDNTGVDAKLTGWGPFPGGGYREEIDLKVQLKATIKDPSLVGDAWPYSLAGISRYNDLRSLTVATPRILVVLFLPREAENWVIQTDSALSLQRCAYWVSLRGAPASKNDTAQTVYLPRSQRFDRSGLLGLMTRLSHNDIPTYTPPKLDPETKPPEDA
jgi:hypothetical protein